MIWSGQEMGGIDGPHCSQCCETATLLGSFDIVMKKVVRSFWIVIFKQI